MRMRAVGVATGLVAALLALAACGEPVPAAPPETASTSGPVPSDSSSDSSAQPSPEGSAQPTVADPDHSVPPPGRLTKTLVPPDILVYSQQALPDKLTERIRKAKGVTDTERLSLAQVGIENRVITVGAVDPASYRRFTRLESATLQEAWERVAGGELAIDPALGKKLQDDQGYLKLGNDEDAEQVHIGAYTFQVPRVDAVVNEKWGEALGMRLGNALLISTGFDSPQVVQDRIQDIVGKDLSVQILGPDLDPDAVQTAFLTGGSVAQAVGTFSYRVIGGGRIAPDPAWVSSHIRTEPVPILGSVTCHTVMIPQLRAALREVQTEGLADKIHPGEYAGCFYPRFIANTTQLSLHSFGIALDLNVPGNQRGTVGEMDRDVVEIFKKWGFAWGGDWGYTDPMHFEMNRLVEVR
ncbi:M15 family metallopeptidase [Nocardioides sp. LHG3406-4]|uniref:M15 family metallopeptidase n=1 Tax=Nocardioides sp. LHG3406-4 TaxID=2804575 RepID=UPI003CE97D2D